MSHLDDIIEITRRKGAYEVHYNSLIPFYFTGNDAFEQIQAWAASQGFLALLDDQLHSCTFQVLAGRPKQIPPPQ
ncbi:MAG: hypothetical protein A2143_08100 [Gallionellales bacterium RBG_16_57_15]|nr:MAG: hypothetical protein A2143_08100 [Gallionellales bacterium RBG_16_57_15]